MGRGPWALGITALITIGTIAWVHHEQQAEIQRMKEGVFLDAERERYRREVAANAERE